MSVFAAFWVIVQGFVWQFSATFCGAICGYFDAGMVLRGGCPKKYWGAPIFSIIVKHILQIDGDLIFREVIYFAIKTLFN